MNETAKARQWLGWTKHTAAQTDCEKCKGSGIVYHFQHEGNDPHSGFSYPDTCECVIELVEGKRR